MNQNDEKKTDSRDSLQLPFFYQKERNESRPQALFPNQKIRFLSYGNARYTNALKRICDEAYESRYFDTVIGLNHENLGPEFSRRFSSVLQQGRGGGYWIWKPYIIKKQMDAMEENDILVYCDAGCTVNKNAAEKFGKFVDLVNENEYGLVGFQMSHLESSYANEKLFERFQIPQNDQKVRNSGQLIGGIQIIRKCTHSQMLVNKWIETLEADPLLFTDNYNDYSRTPRFRDHRHDQSVFSVLRKMYGCILLPDTTYAEDWATLATEPFLATRIC